MNSNFIKIGFFCVAVILIVWLSFLRIRPLEKYRESREFNKVSINIDVCVEKGADTKKISRILEDVWQLYRDIYTRMINDIAGSDVAKINASFQNPQKIGEDTIKVLNAAIAYKKTTNGAFDVSVRSLMDLWAKCEKENRLPTPQELTKARAVTRLSQIKFLLGNRVELLNPEMKIDLGGIASGFALDQTVKLLRKKGVHHFLIDAGGDMVASGRNCSRKPWTIAIRNPDDRSKILDVIMVSDQAVSTSGGFEKFYSISGERYSHLIDPQTGWPQKNVIAATVIAPMAMENDVLATSVCILGPKNGISLLDSLGGGYAGIIITKDQKGQRVIHKSKLFSQYQIHKP